MHKKFLWFESGLWFERKLSTSFFSFLPRFRLWRLSFITLFIFPHQPLFPFSRRVHLGHLFLQSKTRKYLLWGNFMKHKIFSRDILAFQLSFLRNVVIYKCTLFLTKHFRQNALTQFWLRKWVSVYYKKTFEVRLNYPIFFLVIPYRFDHLCRLYLKKIRVKKRSLMWKKIYEISRDGKFHLGTIWNSASWDTFIPSRQEQLYFETDFPHWISCVPFFEP